MTSLFKKLKAFVRGFLLLAFVTICCTWAQARFKLPESYEALKGCEKQAMLWDQVKATRYGNLPKFKDFGFVDILKLGGQELFKKESKRQDVVPKLWKKYLHRRGIMAQVKIRPVDGKSNTGVFKGSPCGLLRLSLTFRPDAEDRDVAPGLALKVLRDKVPSANISALYSLNGQGKDYNFFKNPLSNIVPLGFGAGAKFIHKIFFEYSDYPEELLVTEMALIDAKGMKSKYPMPVRQIFFVPNPDLPIAISSGPHDVRLDIQKIPVGTALYSIHILPVEFKNYPYSAYTAGQVEHFSKVSEKVADLVTTSEFLASSFGDTGIYFRHEWRPATKKKVRRY